MSYKKKYAELLELLEELGIFEADWDGWERSIQELVKKHKEEK